jgi:GTP-binding protein YchF
VSAVAMCSWPVQNFPYATIEPEEARVIVPDERFDWLCEKYKPKSRVPANLTVYDIAGLTRGASTGAGLGNEFLSHIRAVDAIYQVVRCFDDAEIIHVEGDVDPVRDLDIISDELRLKDIEFTEKSLENQKKKTRMGGQSLELKKAKEEQAIIEKVLAWLNDGKEVRKGVWAPREVSVLVAGDDVSHSVMTRNLIPALRALSPKQRRERRETKPNLTLRMDTRTCLILEPGPLLTVSRSKSSTPSSC